MQTYIPFSGFYNSDHDALIDDAIEQLFQDDQGCAILPDDFYDHIDFKIVHEEYAKLYVKSLTQWLERETQFAPALTFESLYSPREYNFETNRIKCEISLADVQALMDQTNQGDLAAVIKERFTSRSGFFSFYSNDILEWLAKPLETWDENEIETLIMAFMLSHDVELDDYEVMESARCNGVLDEIINEGIDAAGWAIISAHDAQRLAI